MAINLTNVDAKGKVNDMAKNRTLIKLDDKVVQITQGKKGLEVKELTDNEALEVSLLDEGVESLIQNDINKLTNEAYAELKQGFKRTLQTNVLKIAGFDNQWGNGFEVDHCNGRQSVITEYLSDKMKKMITHEMDALITQEDLNKILKDTKKSLLKSVEEQFRRVAQEEAYKQVREEAKDFIASAVKKSITKYQKQAIEKAEVAFLGRTARPTDSDE